MVTLKLGQLAWAAAPGPRRADKARRPWELQTWNPKGLRLEDLGPRTNLEVRGMKPELNCEGKSGD